MAEFDPVSASHAVLVEVMNVLGAFRDEIVIVGGWVPDLFYPNSGHPGSLDVDLAVSPRALSDNAYTTILHRMINAGYSLKSTHNQFTKLVKGVAEPVKVDLVTGQYQAGKMTPRVQVNELTINTLRGVDLAFEFCQEFTISGAMPDGAENSVRARIVGPEAFVLIKAFALEDRKKEKDAYDIAFVLQHFQPNIEELSAQLSRMLNNGLAQEGLDILRNKFAKLESVGPTWAAEVAREQGVDFELARRVVFEDSQALFKAIDGLQPS